MGINEKMHLRTFILRQKILKFKTPKFKEKLGLLDFCLAEIKSERI